MPGCPAFLLRLMLPTNLPARTRIGPEDRICIQFSNELRAAVIEGRLTAIWTHVPHEGKRTRWAGALLKALGLIPGAADYVFTWPGGCSLWLEIKSADGRQSEAQQAFEKWCALIGVRYVVARTYEQAIAAIWREGIYNPRPVSHETTRSA